MTEEQEDRVYVAIEVNCGTDETSINVSFAVHTTREIANNFLNTPQTELVKGFETILATIQGR
jgi:hypothetical protein